MPEEKTNVDSAKTITTTIENYKLPDIMVSKGDLVLASADKEDQNAIRNAMDEINH